MRCLINREVTAGNTLFKFNFLRASCKSGLRCFQCIGNFQLKHQYDTLCEERDDLPYGLLFDLPDGLLFDLPDGLLFDLPYDLTLFLPSISLWLSSLEIPLKQ